MTETLEHDYSLHTGPSPDQCYCHVTFPPAGGGTGMTPEIEAQVRHLAWHGEGVHHWHVGATALDGPSPFPDAINAQEVRTEDVKLLMGRPVYRLCDVPRDHIRAVGLMSSCHWDRPDND